MKITTKIKERFFVKVKKTSGCWHWIASKNDCGYGQFKLNNKVLKAHRVSWIIHNGNIPRGFCVLHKCDNPVCVNPKHLWLGTRFDNNKDRMKKGRSFFKLSKRNIKIIRSVYSQGKLTQKFLAKIFYVNQSEISRIVNNKRQIYI